ncbi:RING-H2 finger protein ATL46-like protein [Drosera capensis]
MKHFHNKTNTFQEIMGLKEPFDCAVCLCEFSEQDKLRLLPLCSHAFHIDCIDTWLLSNSTCPLCRGALYVPGIQIDNPMFGFDDSREDEDLGGFPVGQKSGQVAISMEKMVFHVRLGKFKGSSNEGKVGGREVGETSSIGLDARRCYSMGSYQYLEADSNLRVTLCPYRGSNIKGRHGPNRNSPIDREAMEGKRINIGSKNESFSVSKIWLWSKKGNFHGSSNTSRDAATVDMNLPWTNRAQLGTGRSRILKVTAAHMIGTEAMDAEGNSQTIHSYDHNNSFECPTPIVEACSMWQ